MPATNYPETGYQSTDLFTYLRQNAYVIPVAHAQKFLAENQEMVKPYFLYEDQPGPHEPRITAVIQRNSNGSMYLETLFVQQCFSQRRLAPDYASDLNAQPLELWGPAIQERNDPVILIVQIRVSLAQALSVGPPVLPWRRWLISSLTAPPWIRSSQWRLPQFPWTLTKGSA